MNSVYLIIADTITAIRNEFEAPLWEIDTLVDALADAFKEHDPTFDRVQFLNDCELAEGVGSGQK
ncbi:hypothetical protein uvFWCGRAMDCOMC440_019 [Freshwater phage uvFW-CGR-AMD-COM-C440]|jgi:hypothetical protein|nr:hypothetical protein uvFWCGRAMDCOMC440_019 [Freshwater phage uvFW-CGR-AMD-COM-C440]